MVILKTLSGDTKSVDVQTNYTVFQLKAKIEQTYPEFPAVLTRLIFAGAELTEQENKTLLELGLSEDSICHIVLRAQQHPIPPAYSNTQFKLPIPERQVHYQLQIAPPPYPAQVPGQNLYPQAPGQPYIQHGVVPEEQLLPTEYQIVRTSKYIRWFALLDGVFLLFVVLKTKYFSVIVLGLVLCLCGYIGGRRLKLNFIYAYLSWKFFYLLFSMYALLKPAHALNVIIFFLMILVDGYIIHLCIRLSRWVRKLNEVQKRRIVELTRMGFL